jgi:hypothetical protein
LSHSLKNRAEIGDPACHSRTDYPSIAPTVRTALSGPLEDTELVIEISHLSRCAAVVIQRCPSRCDGTVKYGMAAKHQTGKRWRREQAGRCAGWIRDAQRISQIYRRSREAVHDAHPGCCQSPPGAWLHRSQKGHRTGLARWSNGCWSRIPSPDTCLAKEFENLAETQGTVVALASIQLASGGLPGRISPTHQTAGLHRTIALCAKPRTLFSRRSIATRWPT